MRAKFAFLLACAFFSAGSASAQAPQSPDFSYEYIGEGWRNLRAFHLKYNGARDQNASIYYACGARVFIDIGIREPATSFMPITPAASADEIRLREGGVYQTSDYMIISQNQLVAACAKPPRILMPPEYIIYARGGGQVFALSPARIELSGLLRAVWVSTFSVSSRNYENAESNKLFGPAYVAKSAQFDDLTKYSIDCSNKKIRIDILVNYAQDGSVLNSIEVPPGGSEWFSVVPDSVGERMANVACFIR